jgi:hypothetical protein
MNRLVELFCELREHNGWTIERVGETAETSPFQAAKEMLAVERAEKLLKAPALPDIDFIELEVLVLRGANLSDDDRFAYQKNQFERTVGVGLDRELIDMNSDGRLIDRIAALAEVLSVWSRDFDLCDVLLEPTLQPNGRLQDMKPGWLVAVLMRAAGLTTAQGFDLGATVSPENISRFVSICRANRTVIEEIMGEPIRNDVESKPVSQLNRFLRRVGLKVVKAQTEKVAGKKVRRYGIPADLRERMTVLARSYLEVEARREREREMLLTDGRKPPNITVAVLL